MRRTRRTSPAPLFLTLGLSLAAASAKAQPVDLDPRLVIEEAQAAYRSGPAADEVVATLRVEGVDGGRPATAQQRFTVRIAPAGPGPGGATLVSLDLGPMSIFLEEGRLTAASDWHDDRVLFREFEELPGLVELATALPPIPAPQIALLADEDFSAPTPYTPGVRWLRASADPGAALPVVVLEGQGPHGPVTVVTDAPTGRLLKLTAAVSSEPAATLVLLFEPIDPGNPEEWRIDTAGREPVASATELAKPRAPEPEPPEPALVLRGVEGDLWRPGENGPAEAPTATAVIAVASDGDGVRSLRAAGVGVLAARLVEGQVALDARAAVVFPPSGFGAARFDELRRGWSAEQERRAGSAPDLLWTDATPRSLSEALAHGDAAMLLLGPDGRERGVVSLRADDTAESVAKEISRVLADPAAAPSAPAPPGG